jgi:hypothetical protein
MLVFTELKTGAKPKNSGKSRQMSPPAWRQSNTGRDMPHGFGPPGRPSVAKPCILS